MKKIILMAASVMMTVFVTCIFMTLTACSSDNDDTDTNTGKPVVVVEGGEDNVTEALKKAPGIVKIRKDVRTDVSGDQAGIPVYFAYFNQLVDHNNPSLGTFEQRVAITMAYPYTENHQRKTILHTQGYSMADTADELLTTALYNVTENINEVQVEYRYFGSSLPEPFENLDFNYLSSEQASADLHEIVSALKKTGLFDGKWISTGVSKSGITTALYAYFDELNNWNDINVYVPFCAPFMTALGEKNIGNYLENEIMKDMPEQKQWIFDIGRLAAEDSEEGAAFRDVLALYWEQSSGFSFSELSESEKKDVMCTVQNNYMTNLFGRFAYFDIDSWKDLIPNPHDKGNADFDDLAAFMVADEEQFKDIVIAYWNQFSTRAIAEGERYDQLLKYRQDDQSWPYFVQGAIELGSYSFNFNYLQNSTYINQEDMLQWIAHYISEDVRYPEYVKRYSNKTITDFLSHLNTTRKKMVFVYGENDPWTGAAIPDEVAQKNPNLKKIVVPHGIHTDDIFTFDATVASGKQLLEVLDSFLQ